MSRQVLLCCVVAWLAGCARNARPDSESELSHALRELFGGDAGCEAFVALREASFEFFFLPNG